MFENLIAQEAAARLASDERGGLLAPSMLFLGPEAAGKGTAALELARVLSCEKTGKTKATWNCRCASCEQHRLLLHADLLAMGPRAFTREIAAAAAVMQHEKDSPASKILFTRSTRKLLLRFNPALWEDDPKVSKFASLVEELNEDLDVLERMNTDADAGKIQKLCDGIIKNAARLEADAVPETTPVAFVRRASSWGRSAPAGRMKTLIIENADRMQEGARNALLKLLEEPPARLSIILTTSRSGALLPTIVSRLRPYRFYPRDAEAQSEVIRRVFKNTPPPDSNSGSVAVSISDYLESFLSVSSRTVRASAADFAAALLSRDNGSAAAAVQAVIKAMNNFDAPGSFSRFLAAFLDSVSQSVKGMETADALVLRGKAILAVRAAEMAVISYNQSPVSALENFYYQFKKERP